MTQMLIRIYDSEALGGRVAEHLQSKGFQHVYQFNGPTGKGSTGAPARNALVASMMKANVWKSHAETYADRLSKGKSLVLVHAPFGTANKATKVMESYQPTEAGIVEPDQHPEMKWEDAAPFSSILKLPILSKNRHPAETFSGISSLTKGKAFLSTLIGMPLLSEGLTQRNTSIGMRLLSHSPTPLSSSIGMRTISQSATPLSSMLGLKVLMAR